MKKTFAFTTKEIGNIMLNHLYREKALSREECENSEIIVQTRATVNSEPNNTTLVTLTVEPNESI